MLLQMGYWKNRQIWQQELGFSAPEAYHAVCDACVDDAALKDFVRAHASDEACSFCGLQADTAIAADTDEVLEHIASCLRRDLDDPLDLLPYDSEDGQLVGPADETEDILLGEADWPFANDRFSDFVLEAFREQQWTPRSVFTRTESEALTASWESFKKHVMHDVRFLFSLVPAPLTVEDGDPAAPLRKGVELLHALGDLVRRVGLVAELPADRPLYRIRRHRVTEHPRVAKELGVPEAQDARQSRMSPAGIPLLYTAEDVPTAQAETLDANVEAATLATFQLSRPASVIDLDRLPPIPSLFDDSESADRMRPVLGFLYAFRRDVSARVTDPEQVHVEYVPTQIICEYFRLLFYDADGRQVDGLAWGSAQREGGRNVVLFVGREQCVDAASELRGEQLGVVLSDAVPCPL